MTTEIRCAYLPDELKYHHLESLAGLRDLANLLCEEVDRRVLVAVEQHEERVTLRRLVALLQHTQKSAIDELFGSHTSSPAASDCA